MTRLAEFDRHLKAEGLRKYIADHNKLWQEYNEKVKDEQKVEDYNFLLGHPVAQLFKEAAGIAHRYDTSTLLSISSPENSDGSISLELARNIRKTTRPSEHDFSFIETDHWNSVKVTTGRNEEGSITHILMISDREELHILRQETDNGEIHNKFIPEIERILSEPIEMSVDRGGSSVGGPLRQLAAGLREVIEFEH